MQDTRAIDTEKCIRRFEIIMNREFPSTELLIDKENGRVKVECGSCSAVVTFTADGLPHWDEYYDSDLTGNHNFTEITAIERSVDRLYRDTNVHSDETPEILEDLAEFEAKREQEALNEKTIEEFMLRYCRILTQYFPDIQVGYSTKKHKIYLQHLSQFASVSFTSEGTTSWGDFDDGDYDSKSYGRQASKEFFEPILSTVEKHYYSTEDFETETQSFVTRQESGATIREKIENLLLKLLQICLFIGYMMWMILS